MMSQESTPVDYTTALLTLADDNRSQPFSDCSPERHLPSLDLAAEDDLPERFCRQLPVPMKTYPCIFRILALGLTLALPLTGFSALIWEQKRIDLKAGLDQKEVVAAFNFENTGEIPVTIRDLSTTCECTVAELTKRTYAPGESGTIKAIFTIGDRMGPQERQITVAMDDSYAPVATLTMHVEIPELLSYSARMLRWSSKGPADEKSVEVAALDQNRIVDLKVKSISPDRATARVEAIIAGSKYRIVVQPILSNSPSTATITLVATFAGGGERTFLLYALVR